MNIEYVDTAEEEPTIIDESYYTYAKPPPPPRPKEQHLGELYAAMMKLVQAEKKPKRKRQRLELITIKI